MWYYDHCYFQSVRTMYPSCLFSTEIEIYRGFIILLLHNGILYLLTKKKLYFVHSFLVSSFRKCKNFYCRNVSLECVDVVMFQFNSIQLGPSLLRAESTARWPITERTQTCKHTVNRTHMRQKQKQRIPK